MKRSMTIRMGLVLLATTLSGVPGVALVSCAARVATLASLDDLARRDGMVLLERVDVPRPSPRTPRRP